MSQAQTLPNMPSRAVPIVVKRWRCPCCTYSRSRQEVVEAHIDVCWKNPGNRACRTCAHFQPADSERCDCTYSCPGVSWPDTCRVGRELPDGRPVLHCPGWEPEEDAG
ncbi:hypothetical protein [Nocardiopsis synnemataformans]|uniref:hypothetical protein n=1 Tax=Nocardiopsis synnemataformans TaxID=61305 RepID=UPI003EBBF8CB